ncbi:MAG: hypothetical protein KO206_08715 [Methanomicrobiaceae archaeon]|nr:hypothetical protein [Methanomicrobiaceae archaeon]
MIARPPSIREPEIAVLNPDETALLLPAGLDEREGCEIDEKPERLKKVAGEAVLPGQQIVQGVPHQ